MAQYNQQKFFAALKVAISSLSLPLLLGSNLWTQAFVYAQITPLKKQLTEASRRNRCWRDSESLFSTSTIVKTSTSSEERTGDIAAVQQGSSNDHQSASVDKAEIPYLIEDLKNDNQKNRQQAIEALGKIGEPAVPALIEALKDKDKRVRLGATQAIGNIGFKAKAVVPLLIETLHDSDQEVRQGASDALGRIGFGGEVAVPELIEGFTGQKSRGSGECR